MRWTDPGRHHVVLRSPRDRRRIRLVAASALMVLATLALTSVRPEPGGKVILEPPRATVDAATQNLAVREPPLPDLSAAAGPVAPSGQPPGTGPAGVAGGAAPAAGTSNPTTTRGPAAPAP